MAFRPRSGRSVVDVAPDSRELASLPVTPAITNAARNAALVTLSESHGRRTLVDLVAVGSTLLKGSPTAVGEKIADVVVELGSRRWSDLETLVLVAFDHPMPRLEGTWRAANVPAALEEITLRSASRALSTSICVIVPPWASGPADPALADLIGFCETTDGVGVLCSASAQRARCLWDSPPGRLPSRHSPSGMGACIAGPDPAEPRGRNQLAGISSHPQVLPGPGPGPAQGLENATLNARRHEHATKKPIQGPEATAVEICGARQRPGQWRFRVLPVPQTTHRACRVPRHAS